MALVEDKKVGQLNGPWSVLLRFLLATYPLIIVWAVWVTSSISINCADIAVINSRLYAVEKIEIPPSWFKEQVHQLGVDQHNSFIRLEKQLESIRHDHK